jgi:hypothetical protein
MKKLAICFVLFFMTLQVYSVELWNGFTSDMTKEDVMEKVPKFIEKIQDIRISDTFEKYGFYETTMITKLYSQYKLPPMESIHITSLSSIYGKTDHGNINFYFHDDKLLCIEIIWANEENKSLFEVYKMKYGDNYSTINAIIVTFRLWELPDFDFFLIGSMSSFVDKQSRENWLEDEYQRDLREVANESGIIF